MKLVLREAETDALLAFLDAEAAVGTSSTLARVELVRSVKRADPQLEAAARLVLRDVAEIDIDRDVLERAATLPVDVRSLDAIHLASALRIGRHLTALVTYDRRMAVAADELGLPVSAPG